MSEVTNTVPAMTDNELKPTDHVYYGIASLRGWDETLGHAHRWGGDLKWRIGRVLSAMLLAGGDERIPTAITGTMDDNGTGHLALLYPDVVVLVRTNELTANGGDATVTMHPLTAIEHVKVIANHSYYNGTEEFSRESGMEVHVSVSGQDVVFPGRTYSATDITNDASAAAALQIIRQHLSGRTARP